MLIELDEEGGVGGGKREAAAAEGKENIEAGNQKKTWDLTGRSEENAKAMKVKKFQFTLKFEGLEKFSIAVLLSRDRAP
ncbi:hypothetical protein KY285_009595 [Solanum tuberosum]|nr:hypothetical protein KY285_009595 [Solanum tuberosum]